MGILSRLLGRFCAFLPDGHEYFEGAYHEGKAKYYYVKTDAGVMYDGEFRFVHKLGGGMYRKAKGEFDMDKKTGCWEFIRRGSDSLRQVYAMYDEGYLIGELDYRCEEVTKGGIVESGLFLNMSKGMVCGDISGYFDDGDFSGSCDEDGFPDGVWTLTTKEKNVVTEIRNEVWQHGRLLEATHEDTLWKKRESASPMLREKVNYMLDNGCRRVLEIIERGSMKPSLHIPRKR